MKNLTSILAALILFGAATPVVAEEASGDWGGVLAGMLHVIVHITKDASGNYAATLESPDQGKEVIPVDQVIATPDHLSFLVPAIKGGYDGRWDNSQKAWVGTWSQGAGLPLVLKRLDKAALAAMTYKRPQEEAIAQTPLPYAQEVVTFSNATAGVTLAGTFSHPSGAGPFPAVVLISGTGPNNRDEEVFRHKIFLVLADALNRQGIAVLRYDKRGVGKSTGDYATATTADFADDADAAVAWLKTRSDVDPKHIGVTGHSEGGLIAPIVATRDASVAFSVLLAGPGLRGDKLAVLQGETMARAAGTPEDKIARMKAFNTQVMAAIVAAKSDAEATDSVKAIIANGVNEKIIPPESAGAIVQQEGSPWFRYFVCLDPVPVLRELKSPVLVLNGAQDSQVPPKENLAIIRDALKDNPDATILEMPGLNHLFQDAKTGALTEYGQIEETMSPTALETITKWLVKHSQ